MTDGPSFPTDSAFGALLTGLHTATRQLIFRIEASRQMGESTVELERELAAREREARTFQAYLDARP